MLPASLRIQLGWPSQPVKIGPQPGLVDLPVTVLGAVEQHHGQPVAELGTQRGIARGRGGVDVGDRQLEAQFVGQLPRAASPPVEQIGSPRV